MQMGPILLLTNCWIAGNVYMNTLNKFLPLFLIKSLLVLPFKNIEKVVLKWNGFNKSDPGVQYGRGVFLGSFFFR